MPHQNSNKTILITGVTGFIGSHLAPYLLNQGYNVKGTTRDKSQRLSKETNIEYINIPEIHKVTHWEPYLKDVSAVIHLAALSDFDEKSSKRDYELLEAINVQATLNLANSVAKQKHCRFIFLSSIKVNGESTDNRSAFTKEDTPNPSTPYAKSKFKAEQSLQKIAKDTGMELVIIRPSLVYGSNPRGSIKKLIRLIQKKIPLPLGLINNKRSLLYIDNLCHIISQCISNPNATHQIFLAADDESASSADLCRMIGHKINQKIMLLPIPLLLLKALGKITGKSQIIQSLTSSLEVDNSHTKTTLDIVTMIPLSQGTHKMLSKNDASV